MNVLSLAVVCTKCSVLPLSCSFCRKIVPNSPERKAVNFFHCIPFVQSEFGIDKEDELRGIIRVREPFSSESRRWIVARMAFGFPSPSRRVRTAIPGSPDTRNMFPSWLNRSCRMIDFVLIFSFPCRDATHFPSLCSSCPPITMPSMSVLTSMFLDASQWS